MIIAKEITRKLMSTTDLMDPTAAKIVLAVDRGDSINRISEKIGSSYSWVYDWIERLDDSSILLNTDSGLEVVDHELRRQYTDMIAALYRREEIAQEDAYLIPHFAGMEFAYTEIDAAFVWTHGGYQLARSYDDYPVFVRVHDRDIERWIAFFDQFGIESAIRERPAASEIDGSVYYVLFPTTDGMDVEWVDGNPVIPLDEAVEQMLADRAAYEPALEVVADEYEVDVDANHHDSPTTADQGGSTE